MNGCGVIKPPAAELRAAIVLHGLDDFRPLLQDVHAQQAFQPDRRPPALSPLRVVRLDHFRQSGLRHHLLHLFQKNLTPGTFLLPVVLGLRKTGLARHLCHLRHDTPAQDVIAEKI